MRARVIPDDGQNLRFCRMANEEAYRTVRVPIRRSGNQESAVARGRFFGDNCGEWWRMAGLQVTRFLGFGHGRSWSKSVVLVSSGEAWICANLIS